MRERFEFSSSESESERRVSASECESVRGVDNAPLGLPLDG